MSSGRCLVRVLAVFALSLAPAWAEPGGVIEGEVRVLSERLFGGTAPGDDHSGVVIYLTGFTRPPPAEEGGAGVGQRPPPGGPPRDGTKPRV